MLNYIKSLFSSKTQKNLIRAEADFDALMREIDKDVTDLEDIALDVNNKFEDINDDVKALKQEVDELINV